MHLAQSLLNAETRKGSIGVWGHDPHDTTGSGIKSGSNDTQDDIFTGKDSSDASAVVLHNTDGGGMMLAHEDGGLLDASLNANGCGASAGIEDGAQVGEGHLVP